MATLVKDDNGFAVQGGAASTGSSVPGFVGVKGARAATTNPAAGADATVVPLMSDKVGKTVAVIGGPRELVGVQQTALAASTETTFVTAGTSGVFNDLTQLIITTAGAVAATLTIKDATGGTTRAIINYPNAAIAPGSPCVIHFSPALPQAVAANNWTVTNSVTTATNITAVFVKNI